MQQTDLFGRRDFAPRLRPNLPPAPSPPAPTAAEPTVAVATALPTTGAQPWDWAQPWADLLWWVDMLKPAERVRWADDLLWAITFFGGQVRVVTNSAGTVLVLRPQRLAEHFRPLIQALKEELLLLLDPTQ